VWRGLQIRHLASNVARWGLLVGGVRIVENEQAARGVNTPHFDAALINLGRFVTIGLRWAMNHAQPFTMPLQWTGELHRAVDEALDTAHPYETFEVCFQGFHKEHYACDVVSRDHIRFSVPGTGRDRQVSAYQKGLRPSAGAHARRRPDPQPQNPEAVRAFQEAMDRCRPNGALRFTCDDLRNVWRSLLPEYQQRVGAVSRRPGALAIGPCVLDEFNAFYAALLAVAAANDFLCYQWRLATSVYPLESAVLSWPIAEWVHILSSLSGIAEDQCRMMIADLTFSATSIDMKVHPLVPLDEGTLALAPPFVLGSRHDENILRVCSQRRPEIYSITSLEKQSEMLAALRDIGRRFGADGPAKLPEPLPDIDLLAHDEDSSTVLLAELKWIRKPLRPAEIGRSNEEVLKGFGQLRDIRDFLARSPDHLQTLGRLPRSVDAYEHVYYLLVARDHWCWREPEDGIAIVTYDAFAEALQAAGTLHENLRALLQYEWLPEEGRDFYVQNDTASVNGVSIESPVFYSTDVSRRQLIRGLAVQHFQEP
jgi:hypothetical protein